jgi:hypothetical protein
MEKEFITYEQALELKGLGFNEPCFGWFRSTLIPSNFTEYFLETEFGMNESPSDWVNSNFLDKACSAPLYQQAFSFFREKYNIFPYTYTGNGNLFHYCMFIKDRDNQYHSNDLYLSNEEAELECLKKLIEIVKEK